PSWLRGRKGGSRRGTRTPRPSFVPRLDVLEDRTLPSTFTVLNTNDSGPNSLRAILGSPALTNGDTIRFDKSLKGQTIKLTSGALSVTRGVTIDGLGQDKLTISGNNASEVFVISSGTKVTIDSLTIANGLAAAGGGIDNAGTLTLRDITLSN